MKPESAMRRQVTSLLRDAGLDPQAVESAVSPGMPDINWVGGWIELKCVAEYPKRAETPIRVPHYTPQQKSWALRREAAGGKVHLLVKVDSDWYLFRTPESVQVGELTAQQMKVRCIAHARSLTSLGLPALLHGSRAQS